MTSKQQTILETAILLFSKEGFHAISTSKIAKQSDVSEGLIFRHFKNKVGLGKAVIVFCNERLLLSFNEIINEDIPKAIITKAIEHPFNITEDIKYWKLLYKLKWELDKTIKTFEHLSTTLTTAFTKSRYKNPAIETQFLIHHLDAITISIIREEDLDLPKLKELLLRKYYLQ